MVASRAWRLRKPRVGGARYASLLRLALGVGLSGLIGVGTGCGGCSVDEPEASAEKITSVSASTVSIRCISCSWLSPVEYGTVTLYESRSQASHLTSPGSLAMVEFPESKAANGQIVSALVSARGPRTVIIREKAP